MINLFLDLMILQLMMGAFDTIYHHELKVGLPRSAAAGLELRIHAARGLLYGVVFMGLAWFEWGGIWVWVLITLVLVEVGLTLWDFVVEDETRLLPKSERITHTLLAINGGAAFCLLAVILPQWYKLANGLHAVHYGWYSWILSLGAVGVVVSGLRDALAAWAVQRLDLQLNLDLGGHKRLLITGGTGFIGHALCRDLLRMGHEVSLLTRQPHMAAMQFGGKVRAIKNTRELDSNAYFDAVINLAGEPVVGLPWTASRKRSMKNSRLQTTENVMEFVRRCARRPKVWVQTSAIGYYGSDSAKSLDETAAAGTGFASELCQAWEDKTNELESLAIRRVILRFGLVFGRSGGPLPMMLLSYRLGAGVILGDGKQYVAWIHLEDVLRLVALAVADASIHGKINAVAPHCPTFAEFAQASGRALHRPVWLRIPASLLRQTLGEMATLFVDGPRIAPQRLAQMAFSYRFPDLRSALMDLV